MSPVISPFNVELRRIEVNGTELNVALSGAGPPMLLVHGWPHTWQVWAAVLPALAANHRVIAPDLRGLGNSARAEGGYDAANVAQDLLSVLGIEADAPVVAVGLDAGVPPLFMLAVEHPERVRRLVVMESLLGRLPGAESFLTPGPPWWFGFHSVPGLAESVLVGHEAQYIDWFLRTGTFSGHGIDPGLRDAFVAAYSGAESLRCGFEYYRAAPVNAEQISRAIDRRLTVPTLAIAGGTVKEALYQQLVPLTDDLTPATIRNCGHIVPLDRPEELLVAMTSWLAGG